MPGAFSSKQNFLFDLDGTLIDSTTAHARAYVEALTADHHELAEGFVYAHHAGWPTRQVFAAMGLPENEIARLTLSKQRRYREAIARGEVKLFAGVQNLLQRLAEMNRQLFIVTGASQLSAQRSLRATGIESYFAGIVAAEDTPFGKPSPEPYLHALEIYGLVLADCLAIEDSESGIISARAAGLDAVLIHTDLSLDGTQSVGDCENFRRLIEP